MNDTGTALTGIAANMGSRQLQPLADEIDKKHIVRHFIIDRCAVHGETNFYHSMHLSSAGSLSGAVASTSDSIVDPVVLSVNQFLVLSGKLDIAKRGKLAG